MRCFHCKAEYDAQHFARIAENRFALHWEDWTGWRFSGRYLIAPGKAGRITPQRLRGILWEERARVRKAEQSSAGNVFTLPARERFDGRA